MLLSFFAFQLTEFTVNERAALLLGPERITAVYSGGLLCTALGFVSFSLMRRLFCGKRAIKLSMLITGVLAIASAVGLLMSTSVGAFLICSALTLLSLGCIGGCVYYNSAMTFAGTRCAGRALGISMGIAVILQYIVQNMLATRAAFIVSVAASVYMLIRLSLKPSQECLVNPFSYTKENKTERGTGAVLIFSVCLMSVVCSLLDGAVLSAHASGQASVSGYVRLFYAVSLLAAGFAADIKDGKYLSLLTVCFMFFSTVSAAFFKSESTYPVGIIFIYIFSGFYVMFLTIRFFKYAPQSSDPTLWAGMGRSVRSLTVALTAIPTAIVFERYGSTALVTASCILSIVILLILLKDISFSIMPQKDISLENDNISLTKHERILLYSRHFALTPRETEVVEKLLTATNDGVREIADSLYISRRVLQRYISSIYDKTNTRTRIGLFQSFSDFQDKELLK